MLKILDKYILKRYLVTFITMILMFIPIGIVIDVSEKVNKMIENKVAFSAVAMYYLNFTIFFANLLFPIFLFLSIIWFTSKLANNTEIIAILSSGISFKRFLKPYIIGASIISVFALLMGFFIVPKASEGYWNFRYNYLIGGGKDEMQDKSDIYRQISKDEYIYVSSFNPDSQMAFNFSMEKFEGDQLKYKVTANRIQYNPKDSTYTLYGFKKRKIGVLDDQLVSLPKKDTVLNIDIEDLTPVVYIAETLPLYELNSFIKKEQLRGSSNLDVYKVVLYKKFSIPVSAFILTIIAVAVSSMKRRGGMGINLAIGIVIAFAFVFCDKIFGVLGQKSTLPPFIAVWIPNLVFGILAIYLLRNAKR
ncbi:lipopolysaccharide export system permease protein [Flavobacterium croceum DSM 17960]|uniref:Lipopolysaccharide export system permease protein n=1 Tax=Flavobacterium croceum DSM 17960 TaxID=1121886 RepID=A0A2S4N7W4_9FLAO|nr:LptF/LptG family permease [Flavobacterium croceum]POS01787.1 lipopolysaccharide export system permease protein [Flavobacterium croceum DSM 17960]